MTIDKARTPGAKRGTLPAFTPVPRNRNRHDGWTPERQLGFIEALADTGSVRSAAMSVNMASEGAYQLRRHPEAGEFRKAWEAALALGVQRIEDVAMDRALNGVEVPVYHFGEIVGHRIVYNDYLLMFILRNRAPKRFAADNARGMSALDKQHIARLKKQWRKDWERQHAIEKDEADLRYEDDLDETLKTMHRNWYLMLPPEAREAYRIFREHEDAGGRNYDWLDEDDAEAKAQAEYEEFFGKGRDRRQKIMRLVDMREWEKEEYVPED